MKEKVLENKIKKSTMKKDYEESKFILTNCYIKQFKKMLKYKKKNISKTWYLYDYLIEIKNTYETLYEKDIETMLDILYSNKYNIKYQISWLLENSYIFNDYKL